MTDNFFEITTIDGWTIDRFNPKCYMVTEGSYAPQMVYTKDGGIWMTRGRNTIPRSVMEFIRTHYQLSTDD